MRHSTWLRSRPRLDVERLEDRAVPAVFNPLPGAADGAAGSLREAISLANTNGENDIIYLQAGVYAITLTGAGENANATGDFDLTEAGHSVTIVGAGAGATTLDGQSLDRIFHVHPGVTVELSGVTLTNGAESSGTDIPGISGVGGAILVRGGTLTVTDSDFTHNSVTGRGHGGALANDGGSTTVDHCTFTNNTTDFGGGAIANGGTLTVTGSTFTDNASGVWGAVLYGGGNALVSDSTIMNNWRGGSGVILFESGLSSESFRLVNTIVRENNGRGDVIAVTGPATAEITGCTIADNQIDFDRGSTVLANADRMTIADTMITHNRGAAVTRSGGSTLEITSCTVSGGFFDHGGGGINIDGGGATTIRHCTITENGSRFWGGGITSRFGELTIIESTVANNYSYLSVGGIYNAGPLTMVGDTLNGNDGGLLNSAEGTATLTNCTISGNVVGNYGVGAGVFNAGAMALTNCTVVGNRSTYAGEGEGVWIAGGTLDLMNTIIAGNSPGDVHGTFNSLGHNLVGDGTDSTGFGAAGDLVGTAGSPIDPLLGPLQNNGGPTQTHALLPGCPAIDTGDNAVFPTATGPYDQRGVGFPRVLSGTIDIGAYEFGSANQPPTAAAGGPYAVSEGGSLTLSAAGSTDPDFDPLTYSWDVNGDGTFGDATGVSPMLTWAQLVALGLSDGPRTVTTLKVRVDDGHGHVVDSPAATLTLNNAPPTAGVSGPTGGVRGQELVYTLTATDPSPVDQAAAFTFRIDWDGDGTVDQTVSGSSGLTVPHTFAASGAFTVLVTAEDKDHGISNPAPLVVTIATAQVQPDPCHPGGTALVVGGTSGNDTIVVHATNSTITVTINGVEVGTYPNPGSVVVFAQGGNDDVKATGVALSACLHGDAGNDTLTGGGGDNTLLGGDGNDTLKAGAGLDSLDGGAGNDSLVGGTGFDSLFGGAGNDTLTAGGGSDVLDGGADNDSVVGGTGNDTLLGGSGADTLKGGGGHDFLDGGSGNNTLDGGDGNDTLLAAGGNDVLDGGGGHDRLDAGAGDDTLTGGSGNDTLLAGDGNDSLDGGGGDDTLDGGTGYRDTLLGGDGDDTLSDADGVARADGGGGADQITLTFAAGWNVNGSYYLPPGAITGGAGDDTLILTVNNAAVDLDVGGGGGNDRVELYGFWHKITAHGGSGTDTLKFRPTATPGAANLVEWDGFENVI